MKLDPRFRSRNVSDRRGRGPARLAGGGGLIAIGLLLVSVFFPDLVPILRMLGLTPQSAIVSGPQSDAPIDDEMNEFVSITLGYTEDFWGTAFAEGAFANDNHYDEPTLVLFRGAVQTRCGGASSQMGPFYCPADDTIYIDPSFYETMARQLNAPGDFAQAYVIAHEVAHHVQNEIGILDQVQELRARSDRISGNRLTVRLELQADCFAGVWARRTDDKLNVLERGDLKEALRAAYSVGDDILQRMGGRQVNEAEFTHGSAEQRERWFRRGVETGQVAACDTFAPDYDAL